jgi:hypothetical protein
MAQIAEFHPVIDRFWLERSKIREAMGLKGADPFRRLSLEFRDASVPFTLFTTGIGHLEEREAPRMIGDGVVGVAW